ncbi:unnamed protein product [Caenorhabditis auriculariae]|uniref:Zinc-hook domain-containing protein n=1 Tax=Caenorhabditis auriculariae TaxID=2777116 RepID=A0A8S1GVJ3_9PELO|nr:unnamed protein product [Caenorhabditis auriculariae]
MAQLLRLKIRGVRSVGDNSEDCHIVTFLNPLTIINGPNGTGKTTTIESLNYITTSALPSGKLNSFIHSPDVARKSRVDGSIALEFKDVKGRVCTATKRMVATVKEGKLQCKSEEFTLKVQMPNGREHTISSKVSDFQRAMIQHMGVPPAILDHVIFCHQEESCWPLSEPKELKMRFDRIFQLTKFVKAMETMKKMKRDFDNELKVLTEKQHNAEDKLKSKFKYVLGEKHWKKKKADVQEKLNELTELIADKKFVMNDLGSKLNEMHNAERQKELKEADLRATKDQIALLRVNPYSGTEEQLLQEINEMKSSSDFRQMESENRKIQQNIEAVSRQIEQISKEKKDLEERNSRWQAAIMHRDGVLNELKFLEEKIRSSHDESPHLPVIEMLDHEISQKTRKMQECLNTAQEDLDEYQQKVDSAQTAVMKTEMELNNGLLEEKKLRSALGALDSKLKMISGATESIACLSEKMQKIEDELSNLPSLDENEMNKLIADRVDAQKKLDEINDRCSRAATFVDVEKNLATKNELLEDYIEKISDLHRKHEENWNVLYNGTTRPSPPFVNAIKDMSGKIGVSLADVENELKVAQMESQRVNIAVVQSKTERNELIEEIKATEKQIFDMCGCSPEEVENRLKEVRAELKKARKELAPIDAKTALYESWIEESTEKSCCPLCERKFHTKNSATDFANKLRNVSMSVPEERDQLSKRVLHREELEKQLSGAQIHAQNIIKLKEKEKEVKLKIEESTKEMAYSNTVVGQMQNNRDKLAYRQSVAHSLQNDASMMDLLQVSIDKLRLEISDLKNTLRKRNQGETYSELKKFRELQEEYVKSLHSQGEKMQVLSNKRNSLLAQFNALREQRVSLGENAAQSTHLQEERNSKMAELRSSKEKIADLELQLPVVSKKLELETLERNQRNEDRRVLESELMAEINDLQSILTKYEDLKKKYDTIPDHSDEMARNRKTVEKISNDLVVANKRKMELEMKANDVAGSQTKRRTLDDQLTRMHLEAKIERVQEELRSLATQGASLREVQDSYSKAKSEVEKAEVEVGRRNGILEEINVKLQEAHENLQLKDCVNAEKVYRNICIESCIINESAKDLEKYMRCLDSSLISFHSEKMTAINEIIDDLWRKVYKGMDIETIKIRSKNAETGVRNKAYDYSVVMIVEGGIEVEMRGRCSAGQKMLASLLIRIALADVFGGLCSIIALDEPTTNLDTTKVEHMAEMLNELIAARRNEDEDGVVHGRQFQMIVITHDERLVNKLTLANKPDYIYILGKNHRGLSFIRRQLPDRTYESDKS